MLEKVRALLLLPVQYGKVSPSKDPAAEIRTHDFNSQGQGYIGIDIEGASRD